MPPPRVIRYEEPRPPFLRRWFRFLLRPYFVIPVLLCAVLVVTVLAYYWIIFSARIDNLLKGEVYTRSAGIYAAPKQIHAGQNTSELPQAVSGQGRRPSTITILAGRGNGTPKPGRIVPAP